jgi:uncharacterized protein (TIGR02598 family)
VNKLRHPGLFAPGGFSLVEIVIALGIFAFCIVVLLALMPVGLRAARSVSDESNAVNIGDSIFGGWRMQRAKDKPLTISGIVTNLPSLDAAVSAKEFYFDSRGQGVGSPEEASLKLFYTVEPAADASTLRLRFYWPPLAPTNTAQTRDLVQVFSL